jgi:hypothetical protein
MGSDPRHGLGVTAANEHFTALFAEWLLSHPQVLDGAEPRLKSLWLWHSAEEAEHKCTAFDLYHALGGSHAWRVRWMRRVTVIFLTDTLRQTMDNLRRDGTLWQWTPGPVRGATCWGEMDFCAAAGSPGKRTSGTTFIHHSRQAHCRPDGCRTTPPFTPAWVSPEIGGDPRANPQFQWA